MKPRVVVAVGLALAALVAVSGCAGAPEANPLAPKVVARRAVAVARASGYRALALPTGFRFVGSSLDDGCSLRPATAIFGPSGPFACTVTVATYLTLTGPTSPEMAAAAVDALAVANRFETSNPLPVGSTEGYFDTPGYGIRVTDHAEGLGRLTIDLGDAARVYDDFDTTRAEYEDDVITHTMRPGLDDILLGISKGAAPYDVVVQYAETYFDSSVRGLSG